jgi:hypothetical protein
MIVGLAHINLVVPRDTLPAAHAFYGTTLQLAAVPVPAAQRHTLAWFNIGSSGQQVHIAFGRPGDFEAFGASSSRHPCFRLADADALLELQKRVWQHFRDAGDGAPMECDEPGGESSGEPWRCQCFQRTVLLTDPG